MLVRVSLPVVCLCSVLLLIPTVAFAEPSGLLSKHLPGVEIARCMFPQGKLVLQRGEAFHVLRKGDPVPGEPGFRVLEITDHHAVLIQGPKGSGTGEIPAIPDRLVKIEKGIDGEVSVTLMSARMPRAEGPQLQTDDVIYSPWRQSAGKAGEVGEEVGGSKHAPLIAPRQVDEPSTGSKEQQQ